MASALDIANFRAMALPSIATPADTLPAWIACLTIIFTVWSGHFIARKKPDAIGKEEERRREEVVAMMTAVLSYTDSEDAKPTSEQRLPESQRVFKLLFDNVHGCATTAWGISPQDEDRVRCEALYRRVINHELIKAVDYTRKSREPEAKRVVDKEELKQLDEHESGEKLRELLQREKKAREQLGPDFGATAKLRDEARALLKRLHSDQSKQARELLKLALPVLPHVVYSTAIGMLHTYLRSYFHQIGLWVGMIETGASGHLDLAFRSLFHIWVGHMIIKLIELPEFTYTKRARASFGNIIRNAVLGAMVRQDYEYFDRTSAGVLQDRLNKDTDELGDNLIHFPKQLLERLVWITSNMVQVYAIAPRDFFYAAMVPVLLMCAFQFFTFKFFRECNERARRVEEEGVAATSEVLREIKTVRQFASEQRAAHTYARRNLARQLIAERITTIKRSLEVLVWCIFDSGICLTIILGLPHVLSGRLSAAQLIDCFCKLNFNVNFCLRETLESLPRMARMLEPMGRITDLLQAQPVIEPSAHPAFIDVTDAVQLGALLDACVVLRDGDGKGVTRIALKQGVNDVLTGCSATKTTSTSDLLPTAGAQIMFLSTADHRYITPVELLVAATTNDHDQECDPTTIRVIGGLTYPVRAVFSTKLRPSRFHGRIEFDDVHFAFPTDLRKPVLCGLTFTVEPGEKVAMVGPTGCGKSSCMSLVQRLYEPSKGIIRLDGRPLADYDLHNLRKRVVIVDQNTVMFSASIRENIAYGMDRPVSDEEVVEACKRAEAWFDFVDEKPDKLMTHLKGGANLSGGQRQRLAIARAILRKPDVILLDEATSALDNENEAKVQKALDELARHGSSLVIAHRLSTIRDADKIVVIDGGQAVEIGTHDELLLGLNHETPRDTSLVMNASRGGGESSPPSPADSTAAALSRTATILDLSSLPLAASLPVRLSTSPRSSASSGGSPRDDDNNDTDVLPPKPATLKRTQSMPAKMARVRKHTGATYKRLWDAATGASEKPSLASMSVKIETMEAELASLKTKRGEMERAKHELIGSLSRRDSE